MTGSVTDALEKWRNGDDAAAGRLDSALRGMLLQLIRKRRSAKFRQTIDSEGVVQAALASILCAVRDGKYPDFRNRGDLERLVIGAAIKILLFEIRRESAIKRGGDLTRVEESIVNLENEPNSAEADPVALLLAREDLESLRNIVETLCDSEETAMKVLEARVAEPGVTNEDLAGRMGIKKWQIQTALSKLRTKAQQLLKQNGEIS